MSAISSAMNMKYSTLVLRAASIGYITYATLSHAVAQSEYVPATQVARSMAICLRIEQLPEWNRRFFYEPERRRTESAYASVCLERPGELRLALGLYYAKTKNSPSCGLVDAAYKIAGIMPLLFAVPEDESKVYGGPMLRSSIEEYHLATWPWSRQNGKLALSGTSYAFRGSILPFLIIFDEWSASTPFRARREIERLVEERKDQEVR